MGLPRLIVVPWMDACLEDVSEQSQRDLATSSLQRLVPAVLANTLQKQKGCFNPAWLPQLQLHCQGMYLQADKLTTTSLKFQAER